MQIRSIRLMMDLGDFQRLVGFQYTFVITPVFVCQVFREKIVICFSKNRFEGFADGFAKSLVGKRKYPAAVFPENVLRNCLH